MCEHLKVDYVGFDYQFFHHHQLQQISFFAYLAQKDDFKDVMLNIFFTARDYNPAASGLVHCKDDAVSDDLLYVWTLTNNRVMRHGDPFLSPLSEKLSWDESRPLPFLEHVHSQPTAVHE